MAWPLRQVVREQLCKRPYRSVGCGRDVNPLPHPSARPPRHRLQRVRHSNAERGDVRRSTCSAIRRDVSAAAEPLRSQRRLSIAGRRVHNDCLRGALVEDAREAWPPDVSAKEKCTFRLRGRHQRKRPERIACEPASTSVFFTFRPAPRGEAQAQVRTCALRSD